MSSTRTSGPTIASASSVIWLSYHFAHWVAHRKEACSSSTEAWFRHHSTSLDLTRVQTLCGNAARCSSCIPSKAERADLHYIPRRLRAPLPLAARCRFEAEDWSQRNRVCACLVSGRSNAINRRDSTPRLRVWSACRLLQADHRGSVRA